MLRRLLGTLLIVLGLAAAGLGVASATVWRESDSVVASAAPQGDGTLVVTDPGVLELVGPDVTVRATVPDGGKVSVAIGRDIDVEGWVGIDHSTRVTGLSDWTTLATAAVTPEIPAAPEGQEAPAPGVGADPAGNDMWVAEATGEGSVSLRWTDRPGRWSLLAAGVGEGAQAPEIELTWPRDASTPWLWPGVAAGAVLLLAGLFVLFGRRGGRRPAGPAPEATETSPLGTAALPATPSDTPAGTPADTPADGTPSLGRRWPASLRTPAQTDPAKTSPAKTDPAAADVVGTPADPVAPAAAPDDEPAQRPSRPALMSRRSRRRSEADPAADAGPGPDAVTPGTSDQPASPAPSSPSAPSSPLALAGAAPGDDVAEAPTATGSMPRLTRRELRAQEEARKAAEQTGIAGRIRALTGQIPVVRPASPPPADPAAPTRGSRSQAWRQAWGFDPETADQPKDNDTEGGAR